MYLSKLKIANFRAIKEAEINFQKGVNILIQEKDIKNIPLKPRTKGVITNDDQVSTL